MNPSVLIVGRPNVGKSTLMNKLSDAQVALTSAVSGTTRDYVEHRSEKLGVVIADTAGFDRHCQYAEELMPSVIALMKQAKLILFVVDASVGLTDVDARLAQIIRKHSSADVIVLANKADKKQAQKNIDAFYSLGFDELLSISAERGSGLGALLNMIRRNYGADQEESAKLRPAIISVAGIPNVGKSSLINMLLGRERMLVSDTPGSTRETVRTPYRIQGDAQIILADNPGISRRATGKPLLEGHAAKVALSNMDGADVTVLVLDATAEEISFQEMRMAGRAIDAGSAVVIALNKWDLLNEDEQKDRLAYVKRVTKEMIIGAAVVPISAYNGLNCKKLINTAIQTYERSCANIDKQAINDWIERTCSRHALQSGGKRTKIKFALQSKVRPITLRLWINTITNSVPDDYVRYLTNRFREDFGLFGVPVRVSINVSRNVFAS